MFYFDYMDVTTENEHGDLTSLIAFHAGLLLVRFITLQRESLVDGWDSHSCVH
jgi:hypothetical protein